MFVDLVNELLHGLAHSSGPFDDVTNCQVVQDVHSRLCVCLFVRALTGKRLELSTPNLIHVYSIAEVKWSKVKVTRLRKPSRRTVASDHGRYSVIMCCATCRRGSVCRYDCLFSSCLGVYRLSSGLVQLAVVWRGGEPAEEGSVYAERCRSSTDQHKAPLSHHAGVASTTLAAS